VGQYSRSVDLVAELRQILRNTRRIHQGMEPSVVSYGLPLWLLERSQVGEDVIGHCSDSPCVCKSRSLPIDWPWLSRLRQWAFEEQHCLRPVSRRAM